MLAAQQEAFAGGDFWQARPLILRDGAAAIRARRILGKLIRVEGADISLVNSLTAQLPSPDLMGHGRRPCPTGPAYLREDSAT